MKRISEIYKEKAIIAFQKEHNVKSVFAVPHILKVIVNAGVGRLKDDKEREELARFLEMVTGQKPQKRPARIAIASFKTRVGSLVGYRVTLRGKRMNDFLDRFVSATIPRMRDFRGIALSSVDEHGNLHVGIREHIIFPEMIGEDVRRIYSIQVTVVTNAGSKEKAETLFRLLGFPLAKK
ncbi:MAG: 50S ribosomal protein L5 [Candidatus Ryanbacteria bacterium]|nr:50S ribosomal protein L5 [Candidatus Ryanbacteria bacterium]